MLKEYLKKYRFRKNYTQKQMAELIKTTQSYYSQIESGAKKPGFNIVKRLSKVIGVSEEFIKSLL